MSDRLSKRDKRLAKVAKKYDRSKNDTFANQGVSIEPNEDEDNCIAFSFQDLHNDYGFDNRKCNHKMRLDLLTKMRVASCQTWENLLLKSKQDGGLEKLPVSSLKSKLPKNVISREVGHLYVLRFNGQSGRIIGHEVGRVFHIVFIDPSLELYNH